FGYPLPARGGGRSLGPEEWQAQLDRGGGVLLDVRKADESKIGKFCGAGEAKKEKFLEFRKFFVGLRRDKKQTTLLYLTGGIRCEKAIVEMERRGFTNLFQLKGGILNYLSQFPHSAFEGECFVFDDRVAVTQELRPTSRYRFCSRCGEPGEARITCEECE